MKKRLLHLLSLFAILILFGDVQAQVIYGTTNLGGANHQGVLYKYTATANIVPIINFGIPGGPQKNVQPPENPIGDLLYASNGMIYGISAWGGSGYEGTVYVYNPEADTLGIVMNFDWQTGSAVGGLTQISSGTIYGVMSPGYINSYGTFFKYNPSTNTSNFFHSLTQTEGGNLAIGFTLHSDGKLYIATNSDAAHGNGAILQLDPSNNDAVTKKFNLDSISGYHLYGSLASASNAKLYGLAYDGGTGGVGTIFEFDPVQDTVVVLYNFSSSKAGSADGYHPKTSPTMFNGKLYGVTKYGGANDQGVLFEYNLTTSQYTKLMDFDSTTTGANPLGKLSLGSDGWFYGSCYAGGAYKLGTFFKYHPLNHTFVKLKDFNNALGKRPLTGGFIDKIETQFFASDTVLTAPPFNISFTNETPNASNYIWQWQFGDGSYSYQKNPTHTYTTNGTYTVTLIATDTVNNTQDTLLKQDYLSLSGAAACPVVAGVTPSGMIHVCPGDSVLLHSVNNDPSYSYQWLRSGLYVSGGSDSTYWAKQSGYYQVRVDNGSCWNFSNVAAVNYYPVMPPVIINTGVITPCSNDSIKLTAYGYPGGYLWSTGDTSNNIWVKKSGFYTVSAGDFNGCRVTSLIDTINAALVDPPKICIVGVDSATGHNMIVWNQSSDTRIDSFRVYKEGPIANEFHLIGQKGRTETALFEDINSDPRLTSYRYRIMAVDSCGMETPVGPYHRTIHLMVNVGQNGAWNLFWNPYEGANLGTYHIYRGADSAQMQLIANVPASIHSYTDLTPPTGDIFYLLKVDLPNACNPGGGTTYSLSSSNFFNTKNAKIGVEEIKMHDINLSIFPNPNNGQFTIKINSNTQKRVNLMVFNNLGSMVASEQLNVDGAFSKTIDLSYLSKGIYYLRLQTSDDVVMRKVIIQ